MTKPQIVAAILGRTDDWENGDMTNDEMMSALKAAIHEIAELEAEGDDQ